MPLNPGPDSFTHKFRNKTTLYEYEIIKIWELESKFIIDNKLYGLFPLLSLTKDCDLKACYELIESLEIDITKIKELYAHDLDPFLRKGFKSKAFLLAGLKYTRELIRSLTKEEIMLESVTYKEIIEKGIIKGKEEGKKEDIIYLLRARFKSIPEPISKKIRAIKDCTTLEELIVAAATSNSLKEFEKHLMA